VISHVPRVGSCARWPRTKESPLDRIDVVSRAEYLRDVGQGALALRLRDHSDVDSGSTTILSPVNKFATTHLYPASLTFCLASGRVFAVANFTGTAFTTVNVSRWENCDQYVSSSPLTQLSNGTRPSVFGRTALTPDPLSCPRQKLQPAKRRTQPYVTCIIAFIVGRPVSAVASVDGCYFEWRFSVSLLRARLCPRSASCPSKLYARSV
jgi:hypothetical protein